MEVLLWIEVGRCHTLVAVTVVFCAVAWPHWVLSPHAEDHRLLAALWLAAGVPPAVVFHFFSAQTNPGGRAGQLR